MNREYYVYTHIDPNTKNPFYIGKGSGGRVIYRGQNFQDRLSIWDKRVLAQKGFLFDIIMSDLTEDESYELEEFIISEYHEYRPGLLINEVTRGERARKKNIENGSIPIDLIGLWRNREYMESLSDEEFRTFNSKLNNHLKEIDADYATAGAHRQKEEKILNYA